MNSTNKNSTNKNSTNKNPTDDQLDAVMGTLFDEVLLPLAERMKADGVQAFPAAPDVSWLSYYVRRKRSAMLPADFGNAACADADELAQRLAAHWSALGRDELAARSALFGMAARAAQAHFAARAPEAELAPYVYAMF